MKRFLLLLLFPLSLFGQNTIGFPEVLNYSRQEYLGGLQNWDIKQDKNGLIYVANNEGLLSFDGKYWNLYPLPNKTIVRSVEIGSDQKIYVGGQDELGYFAPGENGHLVYHSLTAIIPKQDRSFGDAWDIVVVNKDVYFRTAYKIFRFRGTGVQTFNAPSQWLFMGNSNGVLYAQDVRSGLLRFDNNIWRQAISTGIIPDNNPVTSIIPSLNGSSLVATLKNGLYVLENGDLRPVKSSNNQVFSNERIYAATPIDSNWVAPATNSNGIYIVDYSGNIIQHFSKREQLQNNNVLSIFLDNQRNLWLGLDNGIDFIAYNSAIKHITPILADGSGYTSIIFRNRFYAGTSTGLYSVELQNVKDLSFSKGNFETIVRGQIWSLAEINNQLLMGQHEGAFIVEGNSARQVTRQQGFWNFVPLSNIFPAQKIVAGNYTGIRFFDYKDGNFTPSNQLVGFDESSRFVAIGNSNQVWVSHPYHGVYRI
ncbi:MAG: two-component regulator propeller domain-containing protein, partial [Flavitalea sp.]